MYGGLFRLLAAMLVALPLSACGFILHPYLPTLRQDALAQECHTYNDLLVAAYLGVVSREKVAELGQISLNGLSHCATLDAMIYEYFHPLQYIPEDVLDRWQRYDADPANQIGAGLTALLSPRHTHPPWRGASFRNHGFPFAARA